MKKSIYLFFTICSILLLSVTSSIGQLGYIHYFAGNGTSGFSGDGGPAIAAQLGQMRTVAVDAHCNVYVADYENSRIRKITPSGIINTVAGNGVWGYSGDGGLAINANINIYGIDASVITLDASGNVYFSEGTRVRKIDIATGIITTVIGTGMNGFSGDGGPAASAQINNAAGLCFDATGNLYIGDNGNYRIRKVNTSGIISTIAGNGNSGYSGDGGPAIAATFLDPHGVCSDASGNLYVADRYANRIRKITPSGIITTYAGNGSPGYSGDGGPATSATFNGPTDLCTDIYGNLYIADHGNLCVRKVTPSGVISTFAGGGMSTANNIPATSALLLGPWGIAIDNYNNIYIPDGTHNRVGKVGTDLPTTSSDSLSVFISNICSATQFNIVPSHYLPSYQLKTYFGDGQISTNIFSAPTGTAIINHAFNSSGTYTMKHVLYNGLIPEDSLTYSYVYKFCKTIHVGFYYDANNNCSYEPSTDLNLTQTINTEIDSSGVPVDTISSTSGFYYNAVGAAGTIYTFKIISAPTTLVTSCPASGNLSVTIQAGTNPNIMFGLKCNVITSYDLSLHRTMQGTGHHSQVGTIFVQNNSCVPTNATVTLFHSPKYQFSDAIPTPTSISASTITWDVNTLSYSSGLPNNIYYHLETQSLPNLISGDTVNTFYTVTPISGDFDTSNNHCGGVDTVKGSYDPNVMLVTPTGTISAGTVLKYFIEFENDGNDTAHNIYVMDTLSDNIVLNSLAIESASAVMDISIFNDGSHNIVKFDFPKINLLDSSHHGACSGYVQFYIKSKLSLPVGTHIYNHAGIFFDDNEVVMTNTVDNIIGGQTTSVSGVKTIDNVSVFPNPTKDNIVIQTTEKYDTYTIINSIGQTIFHQSLNSTITTVDVTLLPAGVYQVLLQGSNGTTVKRFVKE